MIRCLRLNPIVDCLIFYAFALLQTIKVKSPQVPCANMFFGYGGLAPVRLFAVQNALKKSTDEPNPKAVLKIHMNKG